MKLRLFPSRRRKDAHPYVLDSLRGSAETHFVKPGYAARSEVRYCHRSAGSIESQEEVYLAAAELARSLGAKGVIDLGCGYGEKSLRHLGDLRIIGVDFGPNIAHCREQHPEHTWHDVNLSQPHSLAVENVAECIVICADVIEHLIEPQHLLATLRSLSRQALAVVVSTPERDLERGCPHMGPPQNQAHAREWNMLEFQRLLSHWEIPATLCLVRADRKATQPKTILATSTQRAA